MIEFCLITVEAKPVTHYQLEKHKNSERQRFLKTMWTTPQRLAAQKHLQRVTGCHKQIPPGAHEARVCKCYCSINKVV